MINYNEYVGKKINMLTILSMEDNMFTCRCDCGNIKKIKKYNVVRGLNKSCGCLRYKKRKDVLVSYVGKKFNHLTIIEELGGNKIKCRCDCGNIVIASKTNVVQGQKKSCGCLKKSTSKVIKAGYVGKKFNNLTILKEYLKDKKGRSIRMFQCRCDCGNIIEAEKWNVLRGHTKSCGCTRKTFLFKNRIGEKFNKLTIIEELGGNKIKCRCDCGTIKTFHKGQVVAGKIKSCGCTRKKG